MRSPRANGARAKTPLPWTPERRTWMRGPARFAALGSGVLEARASAIGFFGYIEFMGARACARAREKPAIVGMRSRLAFEDRRKNHDKVTDHCREAFRGAGHRARAHPFGGQVRQARRIF